MSASTSQAADKTSESTIASSEATRAQMLRLKQPLTLMCLP